MIERWQRDQVISALKVRRVVFCGGCAAHSGALRGFVKKDIGVLSQSKSPGRIAILSANAQFQARWFVSLMLTGWS